MNNELLDIFNELIGNIISDDAKNWLIDNNYFEAPASSRFHLAYTGGLFEHSVNVAESLIKLTTNESLTWQREESPIIIGLFHDLCKCDAYKWDNFFNKYVWNKEQKILGHGDKSVKLINDHIIKLTEEEELCIRWHMGAFDTEENRNEYSKAVEKYPNVLWTHTADMIASKIIEKNDK